MIQIKGNYDHKYIIHTGICVYAHKPIYFFNICNWDVREKLNFKTDDGRVV